MKGAKMKSWIIQKDYDELGPDFYIKYNLIKNREDKKHNDLFFTCGLIEYIARKTHNHPSVIVKSLGKEEIERIYEYADVFHCDNIDMVSDDFINDCHIPSGTFDNISECKYNIPTHWDLGKIYKRLILSVSEESGKDIVHTVIEVFSSGIVDLIENYNSSFYYDNPGSIYATYLNGCVPE